MGIEIERKFLVSGEGWRVGEPVLFRQGYLNRDKHRTVRVRLAGSVGVLTVKGVSFGMTRAEYEYTIPRSDALEMLDLCEGPLIEKKRWLVPIGNMTWEVDEFLGDNLGLIVAEIELEDEAQAFQRPSWLGKEVTDDNRYFNSSLSRTPFKSWGVV